MKNNEKDELAREAVASLKSIAETAHMIRLVATWAAIGYILGAIYTYIYL